MNSPKTANLRSFRSLVIEPFKQIKFGVYILIITTVFLILSLSLVLYAFANQYQQLMDLFHVVDKNSQWELVLNDVFMKNITMIAALYFAFVTTILFAIFKLTHQYYGPIVAIRRFLSHLKQGEYHHRISIRKTDELQDIVTDLNELANILAKK